MNRSNKIKYLYHYTSIETLALILKTKEFKFNRLDKVNDPLDGITEDFPDSKKIVYVACFTARDDDSIPMWSLYTKDMVGVRIRFHYSLFGYPLPRPVWGEYSRERKGNPFEKKENLVIFGPTKVQYLKSFKEIQANTIRDSTVGLKEFYPLTIGIKKIKDWAFEKEWRFKILSFNAAIYAKDGNHLKERMSQINDYIHEDIPHLLLDLEDSAFDDIEILLGPKTNESHRIMVEALIKKYAPKGKLRKSEKKVN
jgi:hypothetical protein